jgi:hypothetical protein
MLSVSKDNAEKCLEVAKEILCALVPDAANLMDDKNDGGYPFNLKNMQAIANVF